MHEDHNTDAERGDTTWKQQPSHHFSWDFSIVFFFKDQRIGHKLHAHTLDGQDLPRILFPFFFSLTATQIEPAARNYTKF